MDKIQGQVQENSDRKDAVVSKIHQPECSVASYSSLVEVGLPLEKTPALHGLAAALHSLPRR